MKNAVLTDQGLIRVFLESGEVEDYAVNDFIAAYGEDAVPDVQEQRREKNPTYYWNSALTLVNIWAKYQGKKKLHMNASYADSHNAVKGVIKGYYGNDTQKLRKQVDKLFESVEKSLKNFKSVCKEYGVKPVSVDWLSKKLPRDKYYDSIRGKINRRMNKPAESLIDLM